MRRALRKFIYSMCNRSRSTDEAADVVPVRLQERRFS